MEHLLFKISKDVFVSREASKDYVAPRRQFCVPRDYVEIFRLFWLDCNFDDPISTDHRDMFYGI